MTGIASNPSGLLFCSQAQYRKTVDVRKDQFVYGEEEGCIQRKQESIFLKYVQWDKFLYLLFFKL